jgi:hypothetical protein
LTTDTQDPRFCCFLTDRDELKWHISKQLSEYARVLPLTVRALPTCLNFLSDIHEPLNANETIEILIAVFAIARVEKELPIFTKFRILARHFRVELLLYVLIDEPILMKARKERDEPTEKLSKLEQLLSVPIDLTLSALPRLQMFTTEPFPII